MLFCGSKASCNTARPSIHVIVLSTSRKATGTVLKSSLILENSKDGCTARVHFLWDVIWFFEFDLFYLKHKPVKKKSKKILFQKHLNAIYLNQNISLTWQLLQGTITFLLPATRSTKQWGSPQGVCLLGIAAVHAISEQLETSSSSIPALSCENWNI